MTDDDPKGTPPRRVNNREHFKKHGLAPPCPAMGPEAGTLTSAIFMVRV
jgi:hypothetical protein